MRYRKFKGDQLFTGYDLNEHVLIADAEGRVEDIVSREEAGDDVELFTGTITPGFINSHCHFELSHLKSAIATGTGLIQFLISMVQMAEQKTGDRIDSMLEAEKEMFSQGIVAVIDICNSTTSLEIKKTSRIQWHNLVEVFNLNNEIDSPRINHFRAILSEFEKYFPDRSNLTPHAPYSIRESTLEYINQATAGQVISIHNQEHADEDELFKKGKGNHIKLFNSLGYHQSPLQITGKSSLQSYLPFFNQSQTVLLVHNTYTADEDVKFANAYAAANSIQLVYCLCPNANLYIENTLPAAEMFLKENCLLVLGTDSYASNNHLSIAEEIKSICHHFPLIPLKTVLQWATINPATALGWHQKFGSFEKGKTPGIVLLNPEFEARRLL